MASWHDDKRDRWSPMIDASHPVNTGAYAAYETALEMVGNRKSKGALVELVCWLVQLADEAELRARRLASATPTPPAATPGATP